MTFDESYSARTTSPFQSICINPEEVHATLLRTEMRPQAPTAKKGQGQTVISTIDGEIFRHDAIKLRYLGYVSGSFLDTHDIGTIF